MEAKQGGKGKEGEEKHGGKVKGDVKGRKEKERVAGRTRMRVVRKAGEGKRGREDEYEGGKEGGEGRMRMRVVRKEGEGKRGREDEDEGDKEGRGRKEGKGG